MPNYSDAKESWNEKMSDQEHKSFQKFNLSSNEMSMLNSTLDNDKDRIIKEGNNYLDYANNCDMNYGQFKTFIGEMYESDEQLEQNPQLSKFSSIFKGRKDDDMVDIKEKIVKFKDHSENMSILFASLSGGLFLLEIGLIVARITLRNVLADCKKKQNKYKLTINNLNARINNLRDIKSNNKKIYDVDNLASDYVSIMLLYDDLPLVSIEYSLSKAISNAFPSIHAFDYFCHIMSIDKNNFNYQKDTIFNLLYNIKTKYSNEKDSFFDERNQKIDEQIVKLEDDLRQFQDLAKYEAWVNDMFNILNLLIAAFAILIVECSIAAIVYFTYFKHFSNKLVNQNKLNYDKNLFNDIYKIGNIWYYSVLSISITVDISLFLLNKIAIFKASTAILANAIFKIFNYLSMIGVLVLCTYIMIQIEQFKNMTKEYEEHIKK